MTRRVKYSLILLSIIVPSLLSVVTPPCPEGYSPGCNGKCYFKTNVKGTRPTITGICASYSGWLVTISDSDENNFLVGQYNENNLWIGLTQPSVGVFAWDHEEAGNYYVNWKDNFPKTETAVLMDTNGWKTNSPDSQAFGICETFDSSVPTISPTTKSFPTRSPTGPTTRPSLRPTLSPSLSPPSATPSRSPSLRPSSHFPSRFPTSNPTLVPSVVPSLIPSAPPSLFPSSEPSIAPSMSPSQIPTFKPSFEPSSTPSTSPSHSPTTLPTKLPSCSPTCLPSSAPSPPPTSLPTQSPSILPTRIPTPAPTIQTAAPDISFGEIAVTKTSVEIPLGLSSAGSVYCACYLSSTPSPIIPTSVSNIISKQQMVPLLLRPFQGTLTVASLYPSSTYSLYCVSVSSSGSLVTDFSTMMGSKLTFETNCCKQATLTVRSKYYPSNTIVNNAFSLTLDAPPSSQLEIMMPLESIPGSGPQTPVNNLLFPNLIIVSPLSSSWANAIPISLNSADKGQYSLTVQLSSEEYSFRIIPTNLFEVNLKVTEPPTPPRLNLAIFSAVGDKVFISFDTLTDRASFSGFYSSNQFPCQSLFSFSGVKSSTCEWLDESSLQASFQYSGTQLLPTVGDNITLLENRIRAKCTLVNATACRLWMTSPSNSKRISRPESLTLPVVALNLPLTVGLCDSPVFDLTGSSGSGGREWTYQITAVVTGTNGDQAEDELYSEQLNAFFQSSSFQLSPPSSIPRSLLLDGVVKFHIQLCNFLSSCGVTTSQLTVNSETPPSALILGMKYRTIVSSDSLFVQARGENEACGNTSASGGLDQTNSKDLLFNWKIFDVESGAEILFTSISTDPSKLKLSPYVLFTGKTYLISVWIQNQRTLRSSSASIQVAVETGILIPIISGASIQSLPHNTSLIVDASLSYDQNIPGKQHLSSTWSCYQSSPTLSSSCLLQLTPILLTNSLSVIASDSSLLGTSHTLSLLISDESSTRVSEMIEIELVVVPSSLVSLSIRSENQLNEDQRSSSIRINPGTSLTLTGVAQVTNLPSNNLTAKWSLDDTTIDLSSVSLSPVTGRLISGLNIFNLILIPNSLIGRSTPYLFTFAVGEVRSSMIVYINSPPTRGKFLVSPISGFELNTSFTLSASRFTDDDLPLSYQFTYLTPSEFPLIIRSRSELTSVDSLLPSGQDSRDWFLSCVLTAFDGLDASIPLTQDVHVLKRSSFSSSSTSRRLLMDSLHTISSDETDVDSVQSSINLNSFFFNLVSCVGAPDCSILNRHNCSVLTNACGSCLSGYAGVFGNDNSQCILQTNDNSTPTDRSQESLNCTVSTDCDQWSQCADGVCQKTSQSCPEPTCSGNGDCMFVNVNTGLGVSECFLDDASCRAECSCHGGYSGLLCEDSPVDLLIKESQIEALLNSTLQWIQIDDLTEDRLLSWINTLQSLSLSYYSLSTQSTEFIFNITLVILERSLSVDLYHVDLMTLYGVVDQAVSILYLHGNGNVDLTRIFQIWDQISTALTRTMSVDQVNMQSVYSNLRINNFVAGDEEIQTNREIFLVVPQTELEILNRILPSACYVSPSEEKEKKGSEDFAGPVSRYSLTSFPSKLQQSQVNDSSTTLISNSMRLLFFNSSNDAIVPPQNRNLTMILQHTQQVAPPISTNETHSTHCLSGIEEILNYSCSYPNSSSMNYTITHHCNGTSSYVITTRCPQFSHKPSCSQLLLNQSSSDSGSRSGIYACQVLEHTPWNTTCLCFSSVGTPGISNRRRHLLVLETDDATGDETTTTGDEESIYALSVGVTIHSEFTSFGDTWTETSTQYNSLEDVKETVLIIAMYGSLWSLGFIGLFYCLYRKKQREKQTHKSLGASLKKSGVRTFKKFSSMDSENSLLKYVQSVIPPVFHESPYWTRLFSECIAQHRYLIPFFARGENSENLRMLTVLNVLTLQSMLMFILAVLYDTEYPNQQNVCDNFDNRDDCFAETSASAHVCEWNYDQKHSQYSCSYIEPEGNIQTMIMFSIVISMLTAPINLLVDFLFLGILAAPTPESIKKSQKDETEVITRAGIDISDHRRSQRLLSTDQFPESASFLWFSNETRLLPSQTREAQFLASISSRDVVREILKKTAAADTEAEKSSITQKYEEEEKEEVKSPLQRGDSLPIVASQRRSESQPVASSVSISQFTSQTTLDEVYLKFLTDLSLQREQLSSQPQCQQLFDRSWCLDSKGNWIVRPPLGLCVSGSPLRDEHPNEIMNAEMRTVRKLVCQTYDRIRSYEDHSIGLEILHLFVVDLLGRDTSCAKIFQHKAENDFRRTLIVSKTSKYVAWVIVVLLNFLFIYFSLLRGLERGYGWQRIYVIACAVQFITEIIIYETSECVIIQFLLPNTALPEVRSVMKLLSTLISQVCQRIDTKAFSLSSSDSEISFNSSQYFFVSTNISRVYPQLFESAIISAFRSYLPGPVGMKWNHTFSYRQDATTATQTQPSEGSSSYSNQLNSVPLVLWVSLHTSLTRFAQFLAALPPLFQRLIVHSLQPIVVALILIIWVQLYSHPLLCVPVVLGLLLLLGLPKFLSWSMKRMIAEKNSLKLSLELVTKQTTELLSSSVLEPEHSCIEWAIAIPKQQQFGEEEKQDEDKEGTSNPLNSREMDRFPATSRLRPFAAATYPALEMEDEESCIEMTPSTPSRPE